ncbi:SgcJ/EcaC family oxidoreductase [Stackebrandtia soli]|uniref:SgcJ/EcaC family oxidoreductase n=1 Tax=Stackebrandtia soli TaxID=1892856 RepID=UPI0039E80C41
MTDSNHDTEIAAVTAVVADLEHSQRNELPEAFIALFRRDAIWTTAHGKRLYGRDAIATFTRSVLPGAMRESTVTYTVENILFLRPDVAAVKVVAQYRTLDGEPVGEPNSPLYVMTKEDDRWLLAACQNTPVLAD